MIDHPITIPMLEEGHTLLLGQTRSGKTYQLRAFLEALRRAQRRVGAVDKLGNHWGLTLSADGKRAGLDFVIFGGKRAHVPMSPDDGGKLGRLFVERNIPAIFDVSQWHHDEQQMWVADFAEAVFLHNEGALHLSLDEVQSWIPQGGGGDAFRSVQRLAEQGLGNGIHLIMAAQRWSRIDKSAAGMASLVVTMRQFGTADRKTMRDLLAVSAEDMARIEKEIVSLPAGTGFVWDPGPATLERHAFPANSTFDSSRTPKHGDTPPPPIGVSSELVEELRQLLTPTPAADYPDDAIPAEPMAAWEKGGTVGAMLKDRDERIADLEVANAMLEGTARELSARHDRDRSLFAAGIDAAIGDLQRLRSHLDRQGAPDSGQPQTDVKAFAAAAKSSQGANVKIGGPPANPSEREYRALAVLAAVYPAGLTEAAWAARAGRARSGGAWSSKRARYKSAGLVEKRDGRWFATEAGSIAAAGEVPQLPAPGHALVEWWAGRMGAAGKLLQHLYALPGLTRRELATSVNMVATGGAFTGAIAELKRNELIEERDKRLRISPALTGDNRS